MCGSRVRSDYGESDGNGFGYQGVPVPKSDRVHEAPYGSKTTPRSQCFSRSPQAFELRASRALSRIRVDVALGKLQQLHAAHDLRDLAAFPGNRLEALAGDRRGQHSIRVNDQYRICFVWHEGDADDVEIVDYH